MIKEILEKLALKNDLTKEEMQSAVESIMTGKVDDNDIETFLIALNEKGVKEPEITAAAMVMKDKSLKFDIGDGTHIDTCGTGGDGLGLFNISTASALLLASMGTKVAKHGNYSSSSISGSSNMLEYLGYKFTNDEAILKETPALEARISIIKVIAAIAPMMGLLGTVTGMIATFQSIQLFGTGDPKLMAGGISMALITTVQGLIAALPLMLLHAVVVARSKSIVQVLEEQSAGIIAEHAEKRAD